MPVHRVLGVKLSSDIKLLLSTDLAPKEHPVICFDSTAPLARPTRQAFRLPPDSGSLTLKESVR